MRRLHHTVGWPPIDVYAVGGLYFVEDGHHRVSVARAAGLATIEARVHEFPVAVTLAPGISLPGALARLRAATARPAPPARPSPLAAGPSAPPEYERERNGHPGTRHSENPHAARSIQ